MSAMLVSDELPPSGKKVLACFVNRMGKRRTICGHFIRKFSVESDPDTDAETEYNEETATFYYLEGWYENIENWDEFASIAVCEGEVTQWQPLPDWQED